MKKITLYLLTFFFIPFVTTQAQIKFDNTGNVGIGTIPNSKLEIKADNPNESGLRFSNLSSSSTPQAPNTKALSLDSQGNVILVPTNAGVPSSGIILSETESNTNLSSNGFSAYGAMNISFNAYNTSNQIYRYLKNTATTTTLASLNGGYHSLVWTGNKMISYGGLSLESANQSTNKGSAYDPSTGSWTSIIESPILTGSCMNHSAVWTGSKMILFGGRYNVNLYRGNVGTLSSNGASYDPNSNTWAMISNTNAPNARDYHTAIWIGSKMIIWGGSTDPNGPGNGLGATNTGKIYDPSTNTWANMSSLNAPASRGNATGIWTGSKFIVWGGCADPYVFANPLNSGGIYDPSNDTWISISNTNAPVAKNANIVIWTGSKMIVFGGVSTLSGGLLTSGAVYDPITDTWDNLTATGSPNNAVNGVWAGTKMLVWVLVQMVAYMIQAPILGQNWREMGQTLLEEKQFGLVLK